MDCHIILGPTFFLWVLSDPHIQRLSQKILTAGIQTRVTLVLYQAKPHILVLHQGDYLAIAFPVLCPRYTVVQFSANVQFEGASLFRWKEWKDKAVVDYLLRRKRQETPARVPPFAKLIIWSLNYALMV